MEENQNPTSAPAGQPISPQIQNQEVGSSAPAGKKGKSKKGVFILLGVIAALAVGIFFIFSGSNKIDTEATPTPDSLYNFQTPEETATPEPIDRENFSIEVLNGTGIAKEASFLQGKLANLGYTDIDLGNAEDQNYETTEVTFGKDVPDEIVEEITSTLKDSYKDVKTTTSSSIDHDIQIITGLRTGQTAKPAATATPTEEPTTSTDSGSTNQ